MTLRIAITRLRRRRIMKRMRKRTFVEKIADFMYVLHERIREFMYELKTGKKYPKPSSEELADAEYLLEKMRPLFDHTRKMREEMLKEDEYELIRKERERRRKRKEFWGRFWRRI